jgi:hypothetical protein
VTQLPSQAEPPGIPVTAWFLARNATSWLACQYCYLSRQAAKQASPVAKTADRGAGRGRATRSQAMITSSGAQIGLRRADSGSGIR